MTERSAVHLLREWQRRACDVFRGTTLSLYDGTTWRASLMWWTVPGQRVAERYCRNADPLVAVRNAIAQTPFLVDTPEPEPAGDALDGLSLLSRASAERAPDADPDAVFEELQHGGHWLGAARRWATCNIQGGDTLKWASREDVSVPFADLWDMAQAVAEAAIRQEREARARETLDITRRLELERRAEAAEARVREVEALAETRVLQGEGSGAPVPGKEAEELRDGIEQLLVSIEYGDADLQNLLDTVDARDSLAYLEEREELKARAEAAEATLERIERDTLGLFAKHGVCTPAEGFRKAGWWALRRAIEDIPMAAPSDVLQSIADAESARDTAIRERDEARAQRDNLLDDHAEGAWMARALDAEREHAGLRSSVEEFHATFHDSPHVDKLGPVLDKYPPLLNPPTGPVWRDAPERWPADGVYWSADKNGRTKYPVFFEAGQRLPFHIRLIAGPIHVPEPVEPAETNTTEETES